jgi:hypothetical protein
MMARGQTQKHIIDLLNQGWVVRLWVEPYVYGQPGEIHEIAFVTNTVGYESEVINTNIFNALRRKNRLEEVSRNITPFWYGDKTLEKTEIRYKLRSDTPPKTYIADACKLYKNIADARKAAHEDVSKANAMNDRLQSINIFLDPDTDRYFFSYAVGIGGCDGAMYEPIETVTLDEVKPFVRRHQHGDRGHFKGKSYSVIDAGREGYNGHKTVWTSEKESLPQFVKGCKKDGLEIVARESKDRFAYARKPAGAGS